jgi:prepilin-type N-terminal cleavage/methylation domain-containing protein
MRNEKAERRHETLNEPRIRAPIGREAFTLLELLVVVATICVLASLATPVLTKTIASRAQRRLRQQPEAVAIRLAAVCR